jgi:hypothetical protein
MNSKRKASSAKKNWLAGRRKYTWHLRPPFKDKFDHSHWWTGKPQSEIEPEAALYELARRHPLVREKWLRNFAAATHSRRGVAIWIPSMSMDWTEKIIRPPYNDFSCPQSLYWTCLTGLQSWAKLTYTERGNWRCSVGILKGLDFRWEELKCRSITLLADWKIRDQREAKLGDKVKGVKRGQEIGRIINADLAANPPTIEEWNDAIAYWAVKAYRQGYVLLAVAPDLTPDKAASVMKKAYREHLCFYPPANSVQRARPEQWLPLIEEFEDDETSPSKAKSQVFARYRRALAEIRFT